MNVLDWIFLAVIAILGIRCFVRGFVEELLSVAAYAVGLLAGLLLYKVGADILKTKLGLTVIPEVIAFAAFFVVGFLVVKIIEKLIHEGLEAAKLQSVDRIVGFVFGALEGLVVVSLVLVVMTVQPIFDVKKILEGSFSARVLLPIIGPEVSKWTQGIKMPDPKQIVPNLLPAQPKKP